MGGLGEAGDLRGDKGQHGGGSVIEDVGLHVSWGRLLFQNVQGSSFDISQEFYCSLIPRAFDVSTLPATTVLVRFPLVLFSL